MLSNTCKYGIRAVIYLSMNTSGEEKIRIKKISEDLNIPTPFLSKILQSLAKKKLLTSTKGPHGGFGLGRDPASISLLDIVLIIDGEDIFNNCIISNVSCRDFTREKTPCPVHRKLAPIRNKLRNLFEQETIGSITREIKRSKNILI